MGDRIVERIEREVGLPGLVERLAAVPAADLRSLLLEVTRRRAERLGPRDVLRQYESDRFVGVSTVDAGRLRGVERLAVETLPEGFETLELSPVAPFGLVAALGGLSQNLTVSTVRGSEVVSDSTAVLALECAVRRRAGAPLVRLCSFHRMLRAQAYDDPSAAAHFALLGLCSAWQGTEGEAEALAEHVGFYVRLLEALGAPAHVRLTPLEERFRPLLDGIPDGRIDEQQTSGGDYYIGARIGIWAGELNLVDGGFVDWTQRLLSNRKERLLISGVGIERLAQWA